MKDRLKWLLVGFGFMFGLELLIGQVVRLLITVPQNQNAIYMLVAGVTVAAFLVGGFVMGWMSNKIVLIEPIIAAIAALGLNAVLASFRLSHDVLFFGDALRGETQNLWWAGLVAAIAILTAIAGALIGERINTPESNKATNMLVVLGLMVVVIGPYTLLIGQVPGFVFVIIGLILLVSVGIAFWLFSHESHDVEDMSISPDHKTRS